MGTHAGFEGLLAELNIELWMGDAAKIRAKRVRKKKTDREDARRILQLMLKDDFPKICVPSWDNRDLRQLLWHRHRMVQMRQRQPTLLRWFEVLRNIKWNQLGHCILACEPSTLKHCSGSFSGREIQIAGTGDRLCEW